MHPNSISNISSNRKLSIIDEIVKYLRLYNINLMCSKLSRMNPTPSLDRIMGDFLVIEFKLDYPFQCLISRKALVGQILEGDLKYISKQNLPVYCEVLGETLKTRLEKISIDLEINTFIAETCKNDIIKLFVTLYQHENMKQSDQPFHFIILLSS